ncbi:SapC family protein [Desulfonatronospira thiodismutans ASO3-1]|uniref:SapC family protein n=1 Tax=Desulfonatronospira thiodismutans ASO3-1 TaxID=555779 RepID=D6SN54_9BACT|nr:MULTISPECIES: SapC family protein [Desulfonatronospira]EFI33151.1 SapC family protein [Desulfonatronospira thiodismutans ASO3-1]EFI34180.1 SapC family protein [Desulfonatronospira thiodismutans ASO3-1]RQD76367.1 MAG: multidrug transporter [Desulfonatronospira sp. MSAO_Bac3]
MQPLSKTTHAGKSFHPAKNYQHAKTRTTVPMVISELPRAVPAFPIAFTYSRNKYVLSAVMGLKPEQNLFVTQEGKWQTSYIPAYLRGHPFYLAESQEGKQVVCVDENSDLITDGPDGEQMFGEEGKPTQKMQQIIDFLEKIARERAITDRACAALAEFGVIEPWEGYGGLYKVSEAKLKDLSGEAFVKLRDTGGLKVMYGQLYSLTQMARLKKLAEQDKEPDWESMEELDFEKIKI